MSKILFVYERNIPTVSLMYEMFTNKVVDSFGMDVSFRSIKQIRRKDLESCEVLFLIRPNNHACASIAKIARKAGRFVITYCDDDLLNLPDNLPNIPWRKKALRHALKNSHVICSSSPYICSKYANKTIAGRSAVLNTAIEQEQLEALQKFSVSESKNKVKLVYAAGAGHTALFEKYVMPILDILISRYKTGISLTFVGLHPNLRQYEERIDIHYVASMELAEYRKYMREEKFDIGLAPLHDDEFSKCKYFNKFIEYTISGIVGVYSAVEPYTFVVTDGVNGYLADNTSESWAVAVCKAIDEQENRKKCLANAINKLVCEFGLCTILQQFIKDVPESVDWLTEKRKIAGLGLAKFVYMLLRPFDMLYTAFFCLFHGGIKDLIKKYSMHRMEKKAIKELEIKQ